jgi:hypothetical protein
MGSHGRCLAVLTQDIADEELVQLQNDLRGRADRAGRCLADDDLERLIAPEENLLQVAIRAPRRTPTGSSARYCSARA